MNAKNHTKKWGKNDKKKDKWGKCGEFWANKKANKVTNTMLAFFYCTQSRGRTGTGCPTGV